MFRERINNYKLQGIGSWVNLRTGSVGDQEFDIEKLLHIELFYDFETYKTLSETESNAFKETWREWGRYKVITRFLGGFPIGNLDNHCNDFPVLRKYIYKMRGGDVLAIRPRRPKGDMDMIIREAPLLKKFLYLTRANRRLVIRPRVPQHVGKE